MRPKQTEYHAARRHTNWKVSRACMIHVPFLWIKLLKSLLETDKSYYEINDSKKLQNTCFQIDAKKHLHISSSINYKCIRVTENLYFSWQLRKQGGRNGFIVKIMRQLVFHYSLEFRPDFVDKSKYMQDAFHLHFDGLILQNLIIFTYSFGRNVHIVSLRDHYYCLTPYMCFTLL